MMNFFKFNQTSTQKDHELDLTQLNTPSKTFYKYRRNKRKAEHRRDIYRTRLFVVIALIVNIISLKTIQTFTNESTTFLISFLSFTLIGSLTGIFLSYHQLRFFQTTKYLFLSNLLFTLFQHSIDSTTIATIYLLSFLIMASAGKLCNYLIRANQKNQIPQPTESESLS